MKKWKQVWARFRSSPGWVYAWLGVAILLGVLSAAKILSLADALQVMLMYTLVTVTWWYARETAKMSKSSGEAAKAAVEQAEASKKMAEEVRQQRLSASQPVVWPSIYCWDSGNDHLVVLFENIGNGPALDVDIFLGRGEEPIIRDSEHKWYSYIIAGDRREHGFIELPDSIKSFHPPVLYEKITTWQRGLIGEYTLLVEWRDLYMSGPFFQAKLPFTLEVDSRGRPVAKEGLVKIAPISVKRKPS